MLKWNTASFLEDTTRGKIEHYAVNNVSLSDSLPAEVREAAESEHRTTDAVLEDAVRKYIDDRSWARLREYGDERGRASEFQGEEGIDRAIAEYRTKKRTR